MDRLRWVAACGVLLGGVGAGSAHGGAMTTYVFEGTLNRVDNPTGFFDSSIQTGSPFKMTVSIASDTPNDLAGNPTYGHYVFPTGGSAPAMALTINGQPFHTGSPQNGDVSVLKNPAYGDAFYAYQTFGSTGDPSINSVRLDFDLHATTNKLSSDALPSAVNLADYPVNPSISLSVFYNDNRAYPGLGGVIHSVQVIASPVPEPGMLAIFATSVALIVIWQRRRSHLSRVHGS